MRKSFSMRQVFVIAVAAALAVSVAPMAVDAASKAAGLKSKGGRAVAVDKKGRLAVSVKGTPNVAVKGTPNVAVTNQPSVKVPEGVAVTNQPSVKVPDGVTVTNHPSEVAVEAAPGKLNAATRPAVGDVFQVFEVNMASIGARALLQVTGSERAAVTEASFSLENRSSDFQGIVVLSRFVRGPDVATDCGGAGWTQTRLRRVVFDENATSQLDFSAAPILLEAPAGGATCLAAAVVSLPNGASFSAGASGFRY